MKRTRRLVLLGSVAAVFAVLSGLAVLRSTGEESSWTKLDSVDELRTRFNEDEGSIRIVLLLSPT